MNKNILLILILLPIKSFAIGWDSKAFNESIQRLKKESGEFIKEPKKGVDKIESHIKSTFNQFKEETTKQVANGKEIISIYNNTAIKINQYKNLNNPQQFVDMLSTDLINGMNYIQYNSHNAPIVGPYVFEVKRKIDEIKANASSNNLYIYRFSN
jgi:hypothetical protein